MRTSNNAIEERKKRAIREFVRTLDIPKSAERTGSNELEIRSVFTELCKKSFAASLEVFDVNKPFLAKKCQELLESDKAKPADKIALMKLLLKTLGETVEDNAQTVNINSPKALVMIGTSKKRIEAMLSPKLENGQDLQP